MAGQHKVRAATYRVRAISKGRFVILDADDERVGPAHASRQLADEARDDLQRQYERQRQIRQRPCLCCGAPFLSHGTHNRMCHPCRGASDGLPGQYSNSATLTLPRGGRQS